MYFKIPDILEFITTYVTLNPGDMILTGTLKIHIYLDKKIYYLLYIYYLYYIFNIKCIIRDPSRYRTY